MTQEELMRRGQIQQKKLDHMQVVTEAKAALRALIADASYAQITNKPIPEINTAILQAHLTRLIEKQEEEHRLNEEIKELNY